ncbi:MAG: sigma-54 interaction domain-containing protein, partial [Methylobacter sp.]
MKHIPELLSGWLAHQPLQPLFLKLLDFCDIAGLYIVDRDQQVIHWSQGAEQLSLLKAGDVAGKPCLQE